VSRARQSGDQLAADPLELAGVSGQLVVARATLREHLTHEDEPTCVKQKVIDVMVENG
jgi:hypothetical protein